MKKKIFIYLIIACVGQVLGYWLTLRLVRGL